MQVNVTLPKTKSKTSITSKLVKGINTNTSLIVIVCNTIPSISEPKTLWTHSV